LRRTLIPLAAALAVFAGAAALGFVVGARVLPERVRAVTEGALGRLLRTPVQVEETQVYVHWGLALEARGLSAWPGPAGPALTVERAVLRVDLVPLLAGRVEPRWLRFEGPRLRVVRDAGGAVVAPFVLAPAPRRLGDPAAPAEAQARQALEAVLGAVLSLPLPAPRLEIADGVLSVVDAGAAGPALELRELVARLRRNADRSAGDFELRTDLARGEAPTSRLRAFGQLDPAGHSALRLSLDRLDLGSLVAALPPLARRVRLAGQASGELEVRMQPGAPHRLETDVHLERLAARGTAHASPFRLALPETRLAATFVLADRRLELRGGRLELGRAPLRLEGALELPPGGEAELELSVRASDLAFARLGDALAWLPPAPHARAVAALERVASGRLADLELELSTPLARLARPGAAGLAELLRGLELGLRVEETEVWLGPAHRLESLAARVELGGDRLRVHDAAATWNGVALPHLDLELDGVSHLAWSDDLRCQPPQAAPPLPGRRALEAWIESRRDPREPLPWSRLELEADRILHPTLGCMVEQLRAALTPRADGLDVALEQATWAGAPLEGRGSYRRGPPERLALSLVLGPAWEPVAPVEPAGPLASGRFRFTATGFGPWRIRGSEGDFELRDASLLLRGTRLLLEPQGELHADVDLDLSRSDAVPFATRFRVENGSLADLARSLDRDGTLARGTVSAAGVLEGRLHAGRPALADAVGSGVVLVRDGELQRRLPPVLAIAMASELSPVADREVIPFDGIDAVLSLGQGRLRTDSLALHGPWLRAIASGEVDVVHPPHPTESVVALFFFRNLDQMIARLPVLNRVLLGEDENLINAYFALSGPLGHPEARLIPVKTLSAGPASFVLEGFPAFVRGGLSRLLSVLAPAGASEPEAGERLGS
jgi:hypothetical protein